MHIDPTSSTPSVLIESADWRLIQALLKVSESLFESSIFIYDDAKDRSLASSEYVDRNEEQKRSLGLVKKMQSLDPSEYEASIKNGEILRVFNKSITLPLLFERHTFPLLVTADRVEVLRDHAEKVAELLRDTGALFRDEHWKDSIITLWGRIGSFLDNYGSKTKSEIEPLPSS